MKASICNDKANPVIDTQMIKKKKSKHIAIKIISSQRIIARKQERKN